MKILIFLYILYKINMISPSSLFSLVKALTRTGTNLMAMLEVAVTKYNKRVAIIDDDRSITFKQLYIESNQLADYVFQFEGIREGKKVAILCRNHILLIESIFAVSRVGADLYLLNTDLGNEQVNNLLSSNKYDAIIYDSEFSSLVVNARCNGKKIDIKLLNQLTHCTSKIPRASSGKLILQTGGTTGTPKAAGHKPSLLNYLNPLSTMIRRMNILHYKSAYIGTPIFHGYGLALLLLFIALGKKCLVTKRFDAKHANHIINQHRVELITVVPIMLQRLLQLNNTNLQSLQCIASGSAKLNPKLVQLTSSRLGNVLYNLYGTSETGLNMIATPRDLNFSALTIGKKIFGSHIKIVDKMGKEVNSGVIGEIMVKNSWSQKYRINRWILTGDLGYQDKNGYFYLSGRTDDMIISGGENVYPSDVEHILSEHSEIEDVAVTGVLDEEFGERLRVFVKTTYLTEEDIRKWLSTRVARYQMPREIVIVDCIPYTPLGKKDQKRL